MKTGVGKITGDDSANPGQPQWRRPTEKNEIGAGKNADEMDERDGRKNYADNY